MAEFTITQEIYIELDGKSPFEYVEVKEGDKNSRIIAVTLLQNKQVYEIPAGVTARIKYLKPDKSKILNDCEISGNKILVTYTEQMLTVPGTGKGEIVLFKDGAELKTATYYSKITDQVYKTDGLISDSEFLSLAAAINKVEQAAEKALADAEETEAATEAANAAAAAANTAKVGADTAAGAANTAKANADKAAQAANTAAGDATKATTAANAAAAACEGIAVGINTVPDLVTGKTYTIGIEAGKMYLEETE